MRKLTLLSLLFLAVSCGTDTVNIDQYALECSKPGGVTICHVPPGNPSAAHTITVGHPAVLKGHFKNHKGDHYGPCTCEDRQDCQPQCEENDCECLQNCPPPPRCGDQECNGVETCSTCSLDCGVCEPTCGDQVCNINETCESCITDCGQCPPPPSYCGDESCDISESCDNCQIDCGECPPPPCGDDECCGEDCPETCEGDCNGSGGPEVPTCPDDVSCGENPNPGVPGNPGPGNTPNNPVNNPNTGFAGGCNAHGYTNTQVNQVGAGVLLGLYLLFLFASFKFDLKRHTWVFRGILIALIICTTALVYAFPSNNLKPAPGSNDYWVTESPTVSLPSVSLLYGYENDPVRLVDLNTGKTLRNIIENRHMVHLMAAYSFAEAFQVGIDIPFVPSQDGQGGIGNVRILTKLSVLNFSYLRLGVGIDFGVPSSTVNFVDDEGFTFTPKLLASTSVWRFDFATNLGIELRDGGDIVGQSTEPVVVAPKILGTLGGRFHLIEKEPLDLDIVADAFASTPFRDTTSRNLSLELIGGAQARFQNGLALRVGAGAGLTAGVGTPDYRILGGISYTWGEVPCKKLVVNNVINVVQQPPVEVPVPVLVPVPLPILKGIYFPYDSSKLTLEAQATILENLNTIKWAQDKGLKYRVVLLIGRADKRGTNKYNDNLSTRRVNAVKDFMAQQGFDISKLQTESQGELKSNQNAQTQLALAKDRVVLTIIVTE